MVFTASNSQWSGDITKIANIVPMPESVKPPKVIGNKCETCIKHDVCMLQDEFLKVLHDIEEIEGCVNDFVSVTVNCKRWYGNWSAGVR